MTTVLEAAAPQTTLVLLPASRSLSSAASAARFPDLLCGSPTLLVSARQEQQNRTITALLELTGLH
jgi:hypothetical protein